MYATYNVCYMCCTCALVCTLRTCVVRAPWYVRCVRCVLTMLYVRYQHVSIQFPRIMFLYFLTQYSTQQAHSTLDAESEVAGKRSRQTLNFIGYHIRGAFRAAFKAVECASLSRCLPRASCTTHDRLHSSIVDVDPHKSMLLMVLKINTIHSFIRFRPTNRSMSMDSTMPSRKPRQHLLFTQCHQLMRRPLIRADSHPMSISQDVEIFIPREEARRIFSRHRTLWLHPQVLVRTAMKIERDRNLTVPTAFSRRCWLRQIIPIL